MNPSKKILVVDDYQDNLNLIDLKLQKNGFTTVLCTSGKEALELLEQHEFDLILLDLYMPEMTGTEVLIEVRKKYRMTELPVIIVTGSEDDKDLVHALNSEANDYVTKPIHFAVLKARMESIFRIQSYDKELRRLRDKAVENARLKSEF